MGVVSLTVFLFSLAFCLYTMAGYPLLLFLLAQWKPRPLFKKAGGFLSVSVILPVHNGEPWIRTKLESIQGLHYPADEIEILVVSDGSTDATGDIVREFGGNVRLIEIPRQGKATALNAGLENATGQILFFTDVRQQLHPDSLANLVACFSDPSVGVASGELIILDGSGHEEASIGLYWKYEKWIRKQLSRVDSVLGATGCIYAMRRELAGPLPAGTLVDDMYLPLGAFFRGCRVILDEEAVAYDYPTKLASEFRRKVRTLAGVFQVIGQYPALLGPSNRMWIHFVSHKLARLLMPYALIAAAAASFGLPALWERYAAAAAQVLLYGLAIIHPLVPADWVLKRFTAPARTFVVLMAASLCAVSILFVPSRVLWKETRVSATREADRPVST